MINTKALYSAGLILLLASFVLLALSMFLMGPHAHIQIALEFYGLNSFLSDEQATNVAVLAYLAIAGLALYALKGETEKHYLGIALIGFSLIPIVSLFSSAMWIADLGGFPAIGSGQGVIKYFALMLLGVLIVKPKLSLTVKLWVAIAPVLIVLLWIGGMKFTLLEAQGIEPLVKSSPFMSWMYHVWDLQTTSNIIGVYDLIAVVLLVSAIYVKRLVIPAILMSGAVFAMTQTFFFTWESALSSEFLLTTGGHFLIKDLWFIVNLMLFWVLSQQPIQQQQSEQ